MRKKEVLMKRRRMGFLCAGLVVLLSTAACASDIVTVARVIDGDTFETTDGTKVRMLGIDAPEEDPLSTQRLGELIAGQVVTLERESEAADKYSRTLAYVRLSDGRDAGAVMVEGGFALAYLKYPCSRQKDYAALEIKARTAGRGIWKAHLRSTALPSGTVVPPKAAGDQVTVYVTRTGTKYHRAGCGSLKKSAIPMALSDAAKTYSPCSRCSPPTLSSSGNGSGTQDRMSAPATTGGPQQCAAITKKGSRCKRTAKSGSAYCWQHGG